MFVTAFTRCKRRIGIIPAFRQSSSERNGILRRMTPFSIYLHIPFCRHRCGYCDFNTYAGQEHRIGEYVHALCQEIRLVGTAAGSRLPVHTLFFGGGTPSLLPAGEIQLVLESLADFFELSPTIEITLEANPGTVSLDYLSELRAKGINRLSLGMQSADPAELVLLEREHTFVDVIHAVKWARQAGFENINLDLIYGLPDQSLETWQHSLDYALGLEPDHLSLYALTIEHGTPLRKWVERGLVAYPDGDIAADMYDWSTERLKESNFYQYEISNWAKRSQSGEWMVCKHNLQYWRNQPYLGFGAGAHGYAGQARTVNVLAPAAYIRRCKSGGIQPFPGSPATVRIESIDSATEIGETMMMGMRLTEEGVSQRTFVERFGIPLELRFGQEIRELVDKELVEWDGERLRLSQRGQAIGKPGIYAFYINPVETRTREFRIISKRTIV